MKNKSSYLIMNNYDFFITCASWEPRFKEGLVYNCENSDFNQAILFRLHENCASTAENTQYAVNLLKDTLVNDEPTLVSSVKDTCTWKYIDEIFSEQEMTNKKILLDISTMPRFLIWNILHFLTFRKNEISYIYFSPLRYEECEWLTEDPLPPRLIFKHSGIHLPNRNLILIIQSGFDIGRTDQLIKTYEPEKVILAIQSGEQLNNMRKNIRRHKEKLNYQEVDYFEIDAFNGDHGYIRLNEEIMKYKNNKNIIMASFGPKVISTTMFSLNLKHSEVGLVDVPVQRYNEKYSYGIDLNNIQRGQLGGYH